jgi:hypothetical protein
MIATASARHASQIIGPRIRLPDRQRVTPSIYRLKPLRHFNGLYVILHSGDMAAIVALRWLVAELLPPGGRTSANWNPFVLFLWLMEACR